VAINLFVFCSFDKQRARIAGISQQDRLVPFNVIIQEFIEAEQIG